MAPTRRGQERMHEAYATRLLDALDSRPPAVRAHDGLSLLPSWQEPGAAHERPSWREPRSPTTPRVEGSGRTAPGMPDPQPQALHQPTRLLSRARSAVDSVGPTSLTLSLALAVSQHATVSTVPRFQGRADRPARQQEGTGP
jgi:hypothetical protein